MSDTKFDRKKCKTCIYRGHVSGGQRINNVCCNYSFITNKTCLKDNGRYEPTDIRGNDYSNCNLYQKGPAIQNKPESIVPRRI